MFSKSHLFLSAVAMAAAQSAMAGPIPVIGVQSLQPAMPQMPHIAPPVVDPIQPIAKKPVVVQPTGVLAPDASKRTSSPSQEHDVTVAPAQRIPAASQPTPASKLAAVLSEIPVLKAEAEAARLKADIHKAGQDSGPVGMAMPLASMPRANQAYAAPASGGWTLVGVSGYNGRLTAELRDASGRKRSVVVGQRIEGGWKVRSITASHVILFRGKQRLRLGV